MSPTPFRGVVQASQRFREPGFRRLTYALAGLILLVLTLFPRPYLARVKILPQDGYGGGVGAILGSLGGGLQNFASLLGTHQTVEVYLLIARSHDVVLETINSLHLLGHPGYSDEDAAEARIAREVDVRALVGGVLEVVAKDSDPSTAKQLATGYASAIRNQITRLAKEQTAQKKVVVTQRLAESATRLSQAEVALNQFQSENKLAAPEAELGTAVLNKAALQARLQAEMVELQTARQFGTDENVRVQAIQSEIGELQRQISIADSQSNGNTLGALGLKSTEYLDRYRDVKFNEELYAVYTRYLEQVTVEELSNNPDANVQVIESAYLDRHRQINIVPAALLSLLALIAFCTEIYIPLTVRRRAE